MSRSASRRRSAPTSRCWSRPSVCFPSRRRLRNLDTLVPRLRSAGVTTVISLDPLDHPARARVRTRAGAHPAGRRARLSPRDPLARFALDSPGGVVDLGRFPIAGSLNGSEDGHDAHAQGSLGPRLDARVDGLVVALAKSRRLELALPQGVTTSS